MHWEALELALAQHAMPARVDELRARALPAGMTELLRVALAQEDTLARASAACRVAPAQLVEAARFFVEQQLLARRFEGDPWRQLGLSPGDDADKVRIHHRLLVRLVHPDRSDDWADGFADRVNRAWRQLRDAGFEATPAPATAAAVVDPAWEPVPAAEAPLPGTWAPVPQPSPRTRPVWPLLLAAASLAALAWWSARDDHEPASVPAPVAITLPAAMPAPEPIAADPSPPVLTTEPVPLSLLLPDPVVPAPDPAPRPPPAPVRRAVTAPATTATTAAASVDTVTEPLAQPVPEPAVPPPTPPRQAPSDSEAMAVLDDYSARYQAGDLEGVLALFARDVHADNARFAPVALDLAAAFRHTSRRELQWQSLTWQRHADRIVGHGRYALSVQPRGAVRRRKETGRLVFELVRDGDQARLLSLSTQPDSRS